MVQVESGLALDAASGEPPVPSCSNGKEEHPGTEEHPPAPEVPEVAAPAPLSTNGEPFHANGQPCRATEISRPSGIAEVSQLGEPDDYTVCKRRKSAAEKVPVHSLADGETKVVRLFGDVRATPMQSFENLEYTVSDFYKKRGLCQAVARSELFGNFTLFLICVNAVYLGVDTDLNMEGSPLYQHVAFTIGEQFFCAYFFIEWLVRFGAFESKSDCLRDLWFKFDTLLVFLAVGETWILANVKIDVSGGGSFLSMLRLLRLARMTRILRSIPELWTLLKGMQAATRAVSATLALLVVFIYLFAIVFHLMLADSSTFEISENYGTLPQCMWILLMTGTFMDNITSVLKELGEENPFLVAVFLLFVLLSSLTVMNMLIGVLCEVVSAVAKAEMDNKAIWEVNSALGNALNALDLDRNGDLSQEEVLGVSGTIQGLKDVGVDPEFFNESVGMVFNGQASCPLTKCLEWALLWRMEQGSTVANGIQLTNLVKWTFDKRFLHQKDLIEQVQKRRSASELRLEALSKNQQRIEQQLVAFSEQLDLATQDLLRREANPS